MSSADLPAMDARALVDFLNQLSADEAHQVLDRLGPGVGPAQSASPAAPADDLAAVVRTVQEIAQHALAQDGEHRAVYDALRTRLRVFESNLDEQAGQVSRLFDAIPRVQPTPTADRALPLVQETLHVQGKAGGLTGGRFRCVNRSGRTAEVTHSVLMLVERATARSLPTATLSVAPAQAVLKDGEAASFAVVADLAGLELSAAAVLSGALELRLNGAPHLRVWLEIEVYTDD